MIFPGEDLLDLLEDCKLEEMVPEHIGDVLDNQRAQENQDDEEEGDILDPNFASRQFFGKEEQETIAPKNTKADGYSYKRVPLLHDDDQHLRKMSRDLVSEQKNILRKVLAFSKSIKRKRHNSKVVVKPIFMMIHGGAGNETFYCLNFKC